jgi:hypothetical protein
MKCNLYGKSYGENKFRDHKNNFFTFEGKVIFGGEMSMPRLSQFFNFYSPNLICMFFVADFVFCLPTQFF